MSLYSDFINNTNRICHKWIHYFPIYENFLSKYINQSILLFEIGVGQGGSLPLYKKYLGALSTIVGIDIDPKCKQYEEPDCYIRIGNQKDNAFLLSLIDEFGIPDIIIDDGGHLQSQILSSFKILYPLLNNNGIYIIEDLHTSYWQDYEGGLKKPSSFIEISKNMIDDLNSWYYKSEDEISDFCRNTFGIYFFDSVVVFDKRIRNKSYALATGHK